MKLYLEIEKILGIRNIFWGKILLNNDRVFGINKGNI